MAQYKPKRMDLINAWQFKLGKPVPVWAAKHCANVTHKITGETVFAAQLVDGRCVPVDDGDYICGITNRNDLTAPDEIVGIMVATAEAFENDYELAGEPDPETATADMMKIVNPKIANAASQGILLPNGQLHRISPDQKKAGTDLPN